jgi:hypothetical protein
VVEPEDVAFANDSRRGQERLELRDDRDRAPARAATAVRLRERLVEVLVHDD